MMYKLHCKGIQTDTHMMKYLATTWINCEFIWWIRLTHDPYPLQQLHVGV